MQALLRDDTKLRQEAARIQSQISKEFVEARKISRAAASQLLQNRLMQNADVLTAAGVMSYDKLISTVMELEDHLKDKGNSSEDPLTRLEQWLSEEPEEIKSVQ